MFFRRTPCASVVAVLVVFVPTAASVGAATGQFEVYCDGFGFFLAKIDGAPAPRKLLLFLRTPFPGIPYVRKSDWKEVFVYRNGCVADGKCEVLAHGRVQFDNDITPDGPERANASRVSGKYEIELNGEHLQGQFAAEQRLHKHYKQRPRICE